MLETILFIILFLLVLIIVWLSIISLRVLGSLSLRVKNLENILSFKMDIKENEDIGIHDWYSFWSKEGL